MAKTEELKNMSATRTVTKLFDTSQEEHASRSDDEPLSRTDRFFITSMLGNGYPSRMSLSDETIIGGSSLGAIMEVGRDELYDDLNLEDPFESLHIGHLLNLQKIAWDCFNDVQKNRSDLHARDINLRYALKATDTFIQLYDRLESRSAKQKSIPSGERVDVPLTPKTVIDGITLEDRPNTLVKGVMLQELMEWCRVELYLKLKPQNPFESILADLIVRTHKAGWDCFEQADWWRHRLDARELNLKYNLKAIDSSARLLARLEGYRTNHIERGCCTIAQQVHRNSVKSHLAGSTATPRSKITHASIRTAMASTHKRNTVPMLSSPRCGARGRSGAPCRSPAVAGKRRCRMHGGAKGSGAPRGNTNALKHGAYTKNELERRAGIRNLLREARALLREVK